MCLPSLMFPSKCWHPLFTHISFFCQEKNLDFFLTWKKYRAVARLLKIRCQLDTKKVTTESQFWSEISAPTSFPSLPWENEGWAKDSKSPFPSFPPKKINFFSSHIGLSNFIPIKTFRFMLPGVYEIIRITFALKDKLFLCLFLVLWKPDCRNHTKNISTSNQNGENTGE